MASLSELTVQVLTARLTKRDMSLEELQKEMAAISKQLKDIEEGNIQEPVTEAPVEEQKPQKINLKHFFKKNEVVCIICNKGFKTLKRHLAFAHSLKPGEYRKQFNIPSSTSLTAKDYSEARRQTALDKGLGEGLVKARAARAAGKVVAPVEVPAEVVVKKAPAVVKAEKKKPAPAKKEATAKAPSKKK